jgi:uncharacterized protein
MRTVFADTFYWISFFNPNDAWYKQVRDVTRLLEPLQIITTEDVLSEVLTFYSNSGLRMRRRTHELFLAGIDLYERRLDKGYSLPDCTSMNVMRQLNINEVLTHDKHFAQEGFLILFERLEN